MVKGETEEGKRTVKGRENGGRKKDNEGLCV
jgi:hypothetical protein